MTDRVAPVGPRHLTDFVQFAENPDLRCPCVLLLDTSASMAGVPIRALNAGVHAFRDDLVKDRLASRRVEIAVITFDNQVTVAQDFVPVDKFEPPVLTAQGSTFMGSAIHTTLDMIQERKALYGANGISYYRPWVMMITDGEPQGEPLNVVDSAVERLQEAEHARRVAWYAVGVQDANMYRLSQMVVREPVKLTGLDFTELFVWLSASMQQVAQSRADEQIGIPFFGMRD